MMFMWVFKDHAKLFNIHLELWARLNEKVEELRKMFSEENHKSTLNGTFAYLHKVCSKFVLIVVFVLKVAVYILVYHLYL